MEKGVAKTYALKVKVALKVIPRFIPLLYYIISNTFIVLNKEKELNKFNFIINNCKERIV